MGDAPPPSHRWSPYWLLVPLGLLVAVISTGFAERVWLKLFPPLEPWELPVTRAERIIANEGYEVALWAEAPLVRNPTSLDIDARGRVWVTEAVNYREYQNHKPGSDIIRDPQGDRIVILEDTDGDNVADKSIVFAQDEDLVSPLGICLFGNQVIVSCSPHILVFTDDDGDDRADRKEILLTGFGGHDHDHGVHALVPGPDGLLYGVVGNAGPHIVTDKSGWTLRAGSHYQAPEAGGPLNAGGLVSDDGRVYVGGIAFRCNPDGSELEVIGHNFRNPYEIGVDSFGDVWQSDNDDTESCRFSWVMEGANLGFASADGHRSWQSDQRPGQTLPDAHWHQEDPGVLPAGDVYGAGAPTGVLRYEGDAFGESLRGALLCCEAALGTVIICRPETQGAGFHWGSRDWLIRSESDSPDEPETSDRARGPVASTWFRPSDIAAAPDGSLFVADWYDSYVGAHRVTDTTADGRIFRVVPKPTESDDAAADSDDNDIPEAETLDGIESAINDIRSPAAHVRVAGQDAIRKHGSDAVPELKTLLQDPNPFVRARAVWLLADPAIDATDAVRDVLTGEADSQLRAAAFRALRRNIELQQTPGQMLDLIALAQTTAVDSHPALRREAAILLSTFEPSAATLQAIRTLIEHCPDPDDWLLTAIGLACRDCREIVFEDVIRQDSTPAADWSHNRIRLTLELHPRTALADLQAIALDGHSKWRKDALTAIAFTDDREAARDTMQKLQAEVELRKDVQDGQLAGWWVRRLSEPRPESGDGSHVIPTTVEPGPSITVDADLVTEISRLPGDAERGRQLFFSQRIGCANCHQLDGKGNRVGPELSHIGRRFSREQLAEAILYPSLAVRTGYETWTVIREDGRVANGLLESTGDVLTLRDNRGQPIRIPRADVQALKRQQISIMPDPAALKLTPQETADLIAVLSQ